MVAQDLSDDRGVWSDLSTDQQAGIRAAMQVRQVARDEKLIEFGAPADKLFVVNYGLFVVRNTDNTATVAEIGANELIGEMGFFAGTPRTAPVIAARDSEVSEISRAEFDALAARLPQVQLAITRSLATRLTRLAAIVRDQNDTSQAKPMRVLALVATGTGEVNPVFVDKLRRIFTAAARTRILTSADARTQFSTANFDRFALSKWLADIERQNDLVICITDAELSEWSQTVLRSTDQLLIVAEGATQDINRVEEFALAIIPTTRRRLVRLHATRRGVADKTAAWLRQRDVFMVHHVALDDDRDVRSLARFINRRAIGFVGGGGGAYGPAHIGIYKAFQERGITFDILGGTSAGAVMTAPFSILMQPDDLDQTIQDIFVKRGALNRYTIPLYSLIDHIAMDEALEHVFGASGVEDAWIPFFAVAMDLSTFSKRVTRSGPIWQAVRASCAIPGAFPPFFDAAGHMLVDGGVVDNVPVAPMNALKAGPNLIVDLRPKIKRTFDVDYKSIPGRWDLAKSLINPFGQKKLPQCPSPATVVQLCMFSAVSETGHQAPMDLVLNPPAFPGSSFMDWTRHLEVSAAAYKWALKTIDDLSARGDPVLAEMIRLSSAPLSSSKA